LQISRVKHIIKYDQEISKVGNSQGIIFDAALMDNLIEGYTSADLLAHYDTLLP
jgi:hypothetical protein